MIAVPEILSALSAHEAQLVVEGDRVRVLFPSDRPPPSDLIVAAKANRESLRALLFANPAQRYGIVVAKLASECPALVEPDRWQQALADAQAFLTTWGTQSAALGWTARELFGLHPIPERPAASYQRLSRYDCTGLVWLLQRRPVVALNADSAAIQTRSAGILNYHKHNKPAFGPAGDSLDDLGAD